MFFYYLYGLTIRSELSLPVLLPCEKIQNTYDVEIKYSSLSNDIAKSISLGNMMGFGEQISWLNTEYGTFVITCGNQISINAAPDAEVWQLRPFVLGFGFATLFQQRGIPAFHCSTISFHEKACLFSGLSGAGKSTTTAVFMEKGALMMADDMVVTPQIDGTFYALPAYPQQKLCEDAVKRQGYSTSVLSVIDEERNKYAVPCIDHFCNKPQPICAFFYLEPSDVSQVFVERVSTKDTLNLITQNLFLSISLRITGIPNSYLIPCIHFSQTVPVYRVLRPRDNRDTTIELFQKISRILDTL